MISAVVSNQANVALTLQLVHVGDTGTYETVGADWTTKIPVKVFAQVFPYGVVAVTMTLCVPTVIGVVMTVHERLHL